MFGGELRTNKRAHSPDTFDNNNYRGPPQQQQHFRGGYHGGGGGHQYPYNKRHRSDYEQPQSIEEKISKLGDTGTRFNEIGQLAKEIDAELINKSQDLEEKVKNITAQICKCVVAFPTRIASYATLIGLISVKNYDVSCQIINCVHASYPIYLKNQRWQEALTLMHLLSSLVNCKVIRLSALLAQFELFLELSSEEDIPQIRSDYYVYTVLSSLPYISQELSAESEQEPLERLLNNIQAYLAKRSKHHLANIRVWKSNDLTVQLDYLDSLWIQMQNFKASNWTEKFLPRPYNEKEYRDIMASSLVPQNLPIIQIPQHADEYRYPEPRVVLRVYEDDVVEGVNAIPGSDKIERFCIENHIRNIIDEIPSDVKVIVRHLRHMYNSDSLPIKHLLIETILGELFTLPKTRYHHMYYQLILFEFAKIFPQRNSEKSDDHKFNYDIILYEAVKLLYNNLDTMNLTCYTRFVEWFSFHLNNSDYLFPWQSWSDATSLEKNSRKVTFIRDVLGRCVRLSFYPKMNVIVSVSLPGLMPPEMKVNYEPVHKDNPNAEELAATIKKLILEKADGKTICETLNIIVDSVELPEDFVLRDEKPIQKLLKIDLFIAIILNIASKSLTHLSSAVGKYRNVIKAMIKEEGGQAQLLKTIHSCLETHPQLQVILVDKLLRAELVAAEEIVNWLLSDGMRTKFNDSYLWEIMNNTISNSMQITRKLEKEKSYMIADAVDAKAATKDTVVDEEGTEAKIKTEEEDEDVANKDIDMQLDSATSDIDSKIERARSNCGQLLKQTFTLLEEIITEHVKKCEANGVDHKDMFMWYIIGRMQEIYYNHYDTIQCHGDIVKIIMNYLNYK